jgi:hypothetical protein
MEFAHPPADILAACQGKTEADLVQVPRGFSHVGGSHHGVFPRWRATAGEAADDLMILEIPNGPALKIWLSPISL